MPKSERVYMGIWWLTMSKATNRSSRIITSDLKFALASWRVLLLVISAVATIIMQLNLKNINLSYSAKGVQPGTRKVYLIKWPVSVDLICKDNWESACWFSSHLQWWTGHLEHREFSRWAAVQCGLALCVMFIKKTDCSKDKCPGSCGPLH